MSRILLGSPTGERHLVAPGEAQSPAYEGWVALPAEGEALELQLRREQVIHRLKKLRDQHEFGVVTTPQGVLQVDERSQGRIARAAELGRIYERVTGQPFATGWRMFDNSMAPVNLQILDGWALVMGAHVQHVFARYADLYAAIETAGTMAELEAIQWEDGWDVGAL